MGSLYKFRPIIHFAILIHALPDNLNHIASTPRFVTVLLKRQNHYRLGPSVMC